MTFPEQLETQFQQPADNLDMDPILNQIMKDLETYNAAYNLPSLPPYHPIPAQQVAENKDASPLSEQEFVLESPYFPIINEAPLNAINEENLFPFNERGSPILFRPLKSFNTGNDFEPTPTDLSIRQTPQWSHNNA